ncbi:MAG TPA: YncE family protein [Stellaceae bacterium]
MKALALALASLAAAAVARAADPPPLVLDGKIALGKVSGRIDHLAVDPERRRLFVAELGNDTVGVVDLKGGRVQHRIKGLREPQGVGYVAATDTLYVANAKDGSVLLFRGEALAPAGRLDLKDDADNVRVDADANRVYVGYGSGALAVIDPATQRKLADIPLKAHPESFRLDPASSRIYVNVPDAQEIAVVARAAQKQVASWQVPEAGANFPMALDTEGKRVLTVFRHPPLLVALDAATGKIAAKLATCGDSDDVFVDAKRKRVYVSCGAGYIEVFAAEGDSYRSLARLPTASGARTSLFVPALDRLYLAVRATASEPAAIWVYRPQP